MKGDLKHPAIERWEKEKEYQVLNRDLDRALDSIDQLVFRTDTRGRVCFGISRSENDFESLYSVGVEPVRYPHFLRGGKAIVVFAISFGDANGYTCLNDYLFHPSDVFRPDNLEIYKMESQLNTFRERVLEFLGSSGRYALDDFGMLETEMDRKIIRLCCEIMNRSDVKVDGVPVAEIFGQIVRGQK